MSLHSEQLFAGKGGTEFLLENDLKPETQLDNRGKLKQKLSN